MILEKVKARRIYKGDIVEPQALALLQDEFPDEHKTTSIEYFEWFVVAEYEGEVIGIITVQKYLPKKPILTDCVVVEKYRGYMVLFVMYECVLTHLKEEGYECLIGYTEMNNRGTVKTFMRTGTGKQPMYAIAGGVDNMLKITKQKLQQMAMITQRKSQRSLDRE